MPKILVVFGATGHQGSSVISNVLNDQELSAEYQIRAITRDVNSDKAKQLKDMVEVVHGDMSDKESLGPALTGAHTVFIMTPPSFGSSHEEEEFDNVKAIADAAVQQGATYLIYSTLPSISQLSGGKCTKITFFDAKAKAEDYVRSLNIKSAFFAGGFFMENFHQHSFLGPQPGPDGTWVLCRSCSPNTKLPYFDATEDTGKWIGAILANPDEYEGKTFSAAQALYSLDEIAAALSRATGKKVVYKQLSAEEFAQSLPLAGHAFSEFFLFMQDYGGYFGPETEKLVSWAASRARGKLTTLDEYFERHPLTLD
ncbi:hypothetical protein V2G26_010610 [Clonostachys chloroleuca]